MNDIYSLPDLIILQEMGLHLKRTRLKQNISQQELANSACLSLSTIKKIEKGEIRSFDSFIRVLRILGKLEILLPLIKEEELSPVEYFEFMKKAKGKHKRERASKLIVSTNQLQEESEW